MGALLSGGNVSRCVIDCVLIELEGLKWEQVGLRGLGLLWAVFQTEQARLEVHCRDGALVRK